MILIIIVIFLLLRSSCSGIKENFASLNQEGCPASFPNRTQLLVHKPANFKYCYKDRRCVNWAPRNWSGNNNESVCNKYTVQNSKPSDFEGEVQQRGIVSSPYDIPADETSKKKIREVVGKSTGSQYVTHHSGKTLRQCADLSMQIINPSPDGKNTYGGLGHFEWKPINGDEENCVVNSGRKLGLGPQPVGKKMGTSASIDNKFKQYCVEVDDNTSKTAMNQFPGCKGLRNNTGNNKRSYFVKPVKTCNLPSNSVYKNYGCAYRCAKGYYKNNGQCVQMNDQMKEGCKYL